MQIFIRLLSGTTIVLDVSKENTVKEINVMIEARHGIPAPCQRLIFAGKDLQIDKTLAAYNIVSESTLHCTGRLAPELYIKWQNDYLMRKDVPGCYQNFWHDLKKKNHCKRKLDEREEYYNIQTCENLTVYHLKKIIAKFLCLSTCEIALFLEKEPFISLPNNTLMQKVSSRLFVAKLIESNATTVNIL